MKSSFKHIFLAASAFAFVLSFAPVAHADGGLVCSDISQVRKLLARYAVTDPDNYCLRSMTLADANPGMREEIIREANKTGGKHNLGTVDPSCASVARAPAYTPPPQAYVPPPAYVPPAPVYTPPAPVVAAPPPAPVYVPPAPVVAANNYTTMAAVGGASRVAGSHAAFFMGNDLIWAGLGLLAAGGTAAALIGSGTLTGSTPPSTSCDTTFDCDEYYAQYSLNKMNAKTAYVRGYTGSGVPVAVIDTGVDTSHFEFENRIVNGGGYDFVRNVAGQPDASQLSAHGTEVAGVIAANRNFIGMHGVAFNATIVPIRVFDQNNSAITSFADGIDYARTAGTLILNGSYGPDDRWHALSESRNYHIITAVEQEEAAAYLRYAANGGLIVVPSGNNYATQPNVSSSPTGPGFLPFIKPAHDALTGNTNGAYRSEDSGAIITDDYSALENSMIVVGGVDKNGVITSYSNRCGVAKDWCMVAYSNDIFTTSLNGQYATVSGTSFAAPQVAGAAAILHQAFPSLTMTQIRARLFATAIDLGETGVDSVYGNGLLNLAAATQPLGLTTLSVTKDLGTGPRYSLEGSSMSFGKAFGQDASSMLAAKDIMFLDSQDAQFYTNLGSMVKVATQNFDSKAALNGYGRDMDRKESKVNGSLTLAYTVTGSGSASNDAADKISRLTGDKPSENADQGMFGGLRAFSITDSFSPETSASLHYKDQDVMMLGFSEGDRDRVEHAIAKDGLQNPYAAFASDGYAAMYETDMFGGKTRVAGFFGHDGDDAEAKNFGTQIETDYKLANDSGVFVSGGTLFEQNRVLGSKGEGAFGFGSGTTTLYSGVGTKLALDTDTVFRANGYVGYTDPSLKTDSLITNASAIITSSFNAGIDRSNIREKGDMLRIGVAQPLRVESGDMSFFIPDSRGVTTTTVYGNNFTQDLSASGREIDMEVNYSVPMGIGETVSAGALYRQDAGHKAGSDDALGVVRWSKKF